MILINNQLTILELPECYNRQLNLDSIEIIDDYSLGNILWFTQLYNSTNYMICKQFYNINLILENIDRILNLNAKTINLRVVKEEEDQFFPLPQMPNAK